MARILPKAPSTPASTRFTRSLEKRVLRYVAKRSVLRPGEKALAAVSGGPDSTALLLIASGMRSRFNLDITVAHFDHRLRTAEEAEGDREFVRALAESLGMAAVMGAGDVRDHARKQKLSLEDAARRLRYRFLGEEAQTLSAGVLLLGHTRDDRAETVLLHLLRGAGLDGLAAMRARSAWPFAEGPDLARPLLQLTRQETERYCREAGVTPRLDPTNELLLATRNRLRHELLPALRAFNPRVDEALARLSEAAARDVDHLESEAALAWDRVARVDARGVSFGRSQLAELDTSILIRLFRRAASQLLGSPADVEAVHLEEALAALSRPRHRLSLPHGITVVSTPRSVAFLTGEPARPAAIPETPLPLPGIVRAGRWEISIEEVPAPRLPLKAGPLEAFLDAEAVRGQLIVRSRRPGDRLRPLGLGGEKKVQDVLVDAKVPVGERDGVPILADGAGILWVAGHCLDERAAVRPGARGALRLRARPLGPEDPED